MKLLLFLQEQGWVDWFNYYMSQGTSDWIPRAHCTAENPIVMVLHIFSDIMIGVAYFAIPIIIWYIVGKRKGFFKEYKQILLLFALFILLCGATHFTGVILFWYPMYWADGALKFITGAVSIFTAVTLIKLLPKLLVLPTHSELKTAIEAAHLAEQRAELAESKLKVWEQDVERRIDRLRENQAILTAAEDKNE